MQAGSDSLRHTNIELQRRLNEALAREAATAEVLQVINSSPGDLGPVFDTILERAHTLCGASFGGLVIRDGDFFRAVALRGVPKALAEIVRQDFRSRPDSPVGQLLGGEPFVQVPDIAPLAARAPEGSIVRALVETAGVHTSLIVALRKDDTLLGFITAYRTEVRPFTDKQIALLQNFAAQAVIAMENARLITETREALDQQTATAEVLGVINSSPGDLAPVFDAMLEKALGLCSASYGSLQTFDGELFRAVALRGLSEPFMDRLRAGYRPGPANPLSAILGGSAFVHIPDLATSDDPLVRAGVEQGGMRTLLGVPLRRDDALLGQIVIARPEVRPFSDKQIALLQNFAAQAVIAMENARLLTETRDALEQQTATAEILGVINSSPGDLTPVFDAILEKAHNLCGATNGTLFLRDGERFLLAAIRGDVPEAFASRLRQGIGDDVPVSAPLVAGESFVHIPDVALLEHPIARAAVELSATRTTLAVALRKGDELLGMIVGGRKEVQPFSDKEIALLRTFADQAVIAMENARLLGELRQRTKEVAELNRGLEARVAEQVEELGRVGRLKRFLAPQLAELIVSQGDEKILESHRREIVVVFCDLRGYTAFTETAEPEEVLDFLGEYHGALGPLVSQFEGTLDQFSGDGIMVFFNDPVPIPHPAERAVKMAIAMREAAGTLIADWRARGRDLGFGAGIAQGYATLGQIGFSERSGYTAIGTVCNVAARLCAEAKDGQILLSQRVNVALNGGVTTEQIGALTLRGLTQPVVAYNVPLAATQPAFRIIEGGSPSD
jgi:class 3 adenylate cyclase